MATPTRAEQCSIATAPDTTYLIVPSPSCGHPEDRHESDLAGCCTPMWGVDSAGVTFWRGLCGCPKKRRARRKR